MYLEVVEAESSVEPKGRLTLHPVETLPGASKYFLTSYLHIYNDNVGERSEEQVMFSIYRYSDQVLPRVS